MNKWSFWKKDWFVGLLVALVFMFGANGSLMQSLERKAYDLGVQASSRTPSDKIAVIAIDEQSIANLGRWPWPREIHAKMIDILAGGHAKVIGHTAFFFEPQVDAGLAYIHKIAGLLGKNSLLEGTTEPGGINPENLSGALAAASAVSPASMVVPAGPAELPELDALLLDAAKSLDNDKKLSESMVKANNVLLAMFFELGEPQGKPDKPLPDYVLKNNLVNVKQGVDGGLPIPSAAVHVPIPTLGSLAIGIGHLNST